MAKDQPKSTGSAPKGSPAHAAPPPGATHGAAPGSPGIPSAAPGAAPGVVPAGSGGAPARTAAEDTPEGRAGRYDPHQSTGAAPVGPADAPPAVGSDRPDTSEQSGSGLPRRQPGFPRERPHGVALQRAPEQGGDVTLSSVAELIRRFNDAAKSRDLWECVRLAGLILTDLGETAAAFTGLPPAAPQPGIQAQIDWRDRNEEFRAACRDFDQVKADLVAFTPQLGQLDWHRAGGPASGSPAPMGQRPENLPSINPQNLMAWVQAVAEALDVFRRLLGS